MDGPSSKLKPQLFLLMQDVISGVKSLKVAFESVRRGKATRVAFWSKRPEIVELPGATFNLLELEQKNYGAGYWVGSKIRAH